MKIQINFEFFFKSNLKNTDQFLYLEEIRYENIVFSFHKRILLVIADFDT